MEDCLGRGRVYDKDKQAKAMNNSDSWISDAVKHAREWELT
jgi:hypothetical protein